MSNDVRLDLLKEAIVASGLDGQTKDALADDLKYAQDINGADDTASQGIKRLLISGVRRELIAHQRIVEAITVHANTCGQMRANAKIVAAAPPPKDLWEALRIHFRLVVIATAITVCTAIVTHQGPELFDLILKFTTEVPKLRGSP